MTRRPNEFHEVVASLITDYLPTGRCSIETISRHLRIHRTTLNRRLARANQSYPRLLQTTRIKQATRLCLTNQTLTHVTRQLGFSDLSVFSRWFTTTFGHSARAWRRMQRPAKKP